MRIRIEKKKLIQRFRDPLNMYDATIFKGKYKVIIISLYQFLKFCGSASMKSIVSYKKMAEKSMLWYFR